MKIKKNIGSLDKLIRYIVALILVVTGAIVLKEMLFIGILLLVLALVLALTALFSFCGLYWLFGITTCPLKKE